MNRRAEEPTGGKRYQLKITLEGSEPPVWRRIIVPASIHLGRLHHVIQVVMGWEDDHLHLFRTLQGQFGSSNPEIEGDWGDESKITLSEIAPKVRTKFQYEYDFGDSWLHTVQVEKITPAEPGEKQAVCLEGARACPPEDCGGIPGYWNLLEVIKKPDHPDYEGLMEWVGPDWDPEDFNLQAINAALKRRKV